MQSSRFELPESGSSSERVPAEFDAALPGERQFFGLLVTYFAVQTALRIGISSSIDLDESEQVLLTQKLSWGYGAQPPLYTWIQWSVFQFFGVSVFSLALLKNCFLLGAYFLAYLNARFITGKHTIGMVAAASLLFIPQMAWESQRDLTHSVLASLLSLATFFLFLKLCAGHGTLHYLAFGVCAGLGVLSKYNYVLFLVGLMLAAVSLPEYRRAVLNRKMAQAACVLLLLCSPHILWILDHPELAFSSTSKLGTERSDILLTAALAGFGSLTKSTVAFMMPLVAVYGLILWPRRSAGCLVMRSKQLQLLMRTFLIIYSILILAILFWRVTEIRGRWLQPLLICLPVFAAAALQPLFDRVRLQRLLVAAGWVALVVTACIPARILLAEQLALAQPLNRPYDALANQLRASIAGVPVLITERQLLGGNLRLQFPDKLCATPELAPLLLPPEQRCAFVWDATVKAALPKELVEFAKSTRTMDLAQTRTQHVTATFKYYQSRQMRLGVIIP